MAPLDVGPEISLFAKAPRPAVPGLGQDDPPRRGARAAELQRQVERLLPRLRIAVIHGGDKSAAGAVINPTGNPRSWKSYETVARDIAQALRRLGCREVSVMPEDMRLGERLRREGTDLAWLNTGGVQGYSSIAHGAAMLEMLGIPYVGHDPLLAATLDNKHAFKRQLAAAGLPTAPSMVWHPARGALRPRADRRFERAFGAWSGAYVVKPVSGRASLHVEFVERAEDLPAAAEAVYAATRNHVLIEAYLSGREYCVAVCGPVVARGGRLSRLEEPFAFACVERALDPGERIFTSMDVRPITADRVRPLDEATAGDAAVAARLRDLARDVFLDLALETLVRLDVRADADGNLHVLEANPKPDLKAPTAQATSLICAGLAALGMSYDDLILSLLADRIDVLFSQRRGTADGLLALAA